MDKNKPNLSEFLNSPQTSELLQNRQVMESLLNSDETRKLMEMLNQSSGNELKSAAQSAIKGKPEQLMGLVEGLMKDPQSAKLVEELNKKVRK